MHNATDHRCCSCNVSIKPGDRLCGRCDSETCGRTYRSDIADLPSPIMYYADTPQSKNIPVDTLGSEWSIDVTREVFTGNAVPLAERRMTVVLESQFSGSSMDSYASQIDESEDLKFVNKQILDIKKEFQEVGVQTDSGNIGRQDIGNLGGVQPATPPPPLRAIFVTKSGGHYHCVGGCKNSYDVFKRYEPCGHCSRALSR